VARALCSATDVGNAPVGLADDIQAAQPPVNMGHADIGADGGEFVDVKSDVKLEAASDWAPIFARFNLSPDDFEIVDDTVRASVWQQSKRTEDGDRDVVNLYSYRASFRRKMSTIDLPAFYTEARRKPRQRVKTAPADRATVAVIADPQIGKTGRRGGTIELLDRMQEKREKLAALLKVRRPCLVGIADAGDGFEGFESGGNPMFTNDLSLSQQMDAYATELYLTVELAHRFAPVEAFGVPSNHTAWRNGKQQLGRPEDDLGLFVQRQVMKTITAAKLDVNWTFPAPYDESVAVDILGTVIGLVHGNQFGPGQAIQWWEKQTFGAQAVARADVLVTGHYHTFGAGVAGRNPATGRQRTWLGAPTLDNGSDWYRQTAGRDSDPGLLVFDVTPDGFDLQSLTVL